MPMLKLLDEEFYEGFYLDVAEARRKDPSFSIRDHYANFGYLERRVRNQFSRQTDELRDTLISALVVSSDAKRRIASAELSRLFLDVKLAEAEARFQERDFYAGVSAIASISPSLIDMSNPAINEKMLGLIALAVQVRDEGKPFDSLLIIEVILKIAPAMLEALVEALVIEVYTIRDLQRAHARLDSVPLQHIHEIRITALRAEVYLKEGQLFEAQKTLEILASYDFRPHPFFDAQRRRMLREAAVMQLNQPKSGLPIRYEEISVALNVIFSDIVDSDALADLLIYSAFLGGLKIPDHVDHLNRYLMNFCDDAPLKLRTVVFSYFVSMHQVELCDWFLNRFSGDNSLYEEPRFIKNLDLLVQDSGLYKDLLSDALAAYLKSNRFGDFLAGRNDAYKTVSEQLLAREIAERYSYSSDLSKPFVKGKNLAVTSRTLTVAFFGQIRFPEETLGAIKAYIESDLQSWIASGNRVRFAVSSWDQTGGSAFEPHDPVVFTYNRLPKVIADYAKRQNLISHSDFCVLFPALGNRLTKSSQTNLKPSFIQSTLGVDVSIDLGDERDFNTDTGKLLSRRFPSNQHVYNQGKMWDRIGAVRNLVEGREDDLIMLIRPDLVLHSGSFLDSLKTIEREASGCGCVVDRDAHASMLNGIGDRYILMTPQAANRCFHGAEIFRAILSDDKLFGRYQHRLHAHQLLQTVFYTGGTTIRQLAGDVIFSIFRGQMSLDELRPALIDDASNAPEADVRAFVQSII